MTIFSKNNNFDDFWNVTLFLTAFLSPTFLEKACESLEDNIKLSTADEFCDLMYKLGDNICLQKMAQIKLE